MLPKIYRLTVPQFRYNKSSYTTVSSPAFTLLLKQSSHTNSRFTVVVPKSLDKRATKRNKTRRIVAGVLFDSLSSFADKKDVLIKAKKIITKENIQSSVNDLTQLLQKAQLVVQ